MVKKATIYTDGSCLGNHLMDERQRHSYTAYIIYENDDPNREIEINLGIVKEAKSNQQAEWAAINSALKFSQTHLSGYHISLFSDSKTVIDMINGAKQPRHKEMKRWHKRFLQVAGGLDLTVAWVHRSNNPAGHYLERNLRFIRNYARTRAK